MVSGMRGRVDDRAVAPRWRARLVTMLVAWLVAFLIVTALLSFFGDELRSLPLALRALVMSGVLMTVMTTLVMPALSAAVERWLAGPARRSRPAPDRP
jgi:antibiotic biosynthesis monooxygenase (ABM) superfamily enzyme